MHKNNVLVFYNASCFIDHATLAFYSTSKPYVGAGKPKIEFTDIVTIKWKIVAHDETVKLIRKINKKGRRFGLHFIVD